MAHPRSYRHFAHRDHVSFVALLLLAAVVLVVLLTVPSHKPVPQPRYGSPPATAPR